MLDRKLYIVWNFGCYHLYIVWTLTRYCFRNVVIFHKLNDLSCLDMWFDYSTVALKVNHCGPRALPFDNDNHMVTWLQATVREQSRSLKTVKEVLRAAIGHLAAVVIASDVPLVSLMYDSVNPYICFQWIVGRQLSNALEQFTETFWAVVWRVVFRHGLDNV